jgi:hypothetical protein
MIILCLAANCSDRLWLWDGGFLAGHFAVWRSECCKGWGWAIASQHDSGKTEIVK